MNARPFCKSVGGKSKLAAAILDILPKPKRYFEPFVGGGAVFWVLQERYPDTPSFLNDMNSHLMDVYETIRDDVDEFIVELKKKRYTNTKDAFLKVRAACFGSDNMRQRAAEFIYTNKVGFNGLFRVNSSGGFNVPFGRYDNPTICDEANLRACAGVLQNTNLLSWDFELALQDARKAGDVVYLDPPYVPKSATANFVGYTAKGFNKDDQVRLRDVALQLKKEGSSCSSATATRRSYASCTARRTGS